MRGVFPPSRTAPACAAAFLLLAALGTHGRPAGAQAARPAAEVRAAFRPRVIVIPHVRAGESIRTVLDDDPARRTGVARMQQALEGLRGAAVVDFVGALQSMRQANTLGAASEDDARTRLLSANRADAYVVVDAVVGVTDSLAAANVVLRAYFTANGNVLASRSGYSGKYRGVDHQRLVGRAIELTAPGLIAAMNTALGDVAEHGIPVSAELRVAAGAALSLDAPLANGRSLADTVGGFLAATAQHGAVSITNVTANAMTVSEIRLPSAASGRPMSALQFSEQLVRFLRSVGVAQPRAGISTGAVYVELR